MSAQDVLAALPPGADRVEVAGTGLLADEVRRLLGARLQVPDAVVRPVAVVVASSGTAAVTAALERVEDLGMVVLTGAVPPAALALDLYVDLHVRGLVVVGLPPPPPER